MKLTPEESLAQDLRTRRELAHMTQDDLATQVGAHQTAVSHWESGRGARTILRVLRLAAVLKLKPADFV